MNKKNIMIAIAIVLALLFFLDCFMFPKINYSNLDQNNKNFAVVELFTSEGCSSCPPADELLANLQKEVSNKNIFLLAFHVDYWDRLGWKDSFSREEYTDRQRQYKQWLGLNVLYTPEFVINGTSEFAGDSKSTLYEKVSNALKKEPLLEITLEAKNIGDSLILNYTTNRLEEDASFFLAIIEKKASTKVGRGENNGSVLNHVQIVRNAFTIPLKEKENNLNMSRPEYLNWTDFELIAFVQKNETGEIIAATRAVLK